jgi:electron transfer flavoprotein alpha subunit
MIVYSLNHKDTPTVPFYFGITNNVERRFKEHQRQYERHHPYILQKDDFIIHPLYDTGDNEYSQMLAEKIETNLIKQYATLNYGSNRVYDIRVYFEKNRGVTLDNHSTPQSIAKAKQTREKNRHKKFKKVIRAIKEDPYQYTVEEISEMTGMDRGALDGYTKKYHSVPFLKWIQKYQLLWMECIKTKWD